MSPESIEVKFENGETSRYEIDVGAPIKLRRENAQTHVCHTLKYVFDSLLLFYEKFYAEGKIIAIHSEREQIRCLLGGFPIDRRMSALANVLATGSAENILYWNNKAAYPLSDVDYQLILHSRNLSDELTKTLLTKPRNRVEVSHEHCIALLECGKFESFKFLHDHAPKFADKDCVCLDHCVINGLIPMVRFLYAQGAVYSTSREWLIPMHLAKIHGCSTEPTGGLTDVWQERIVYSSAMFGKKNYERRR